MLSRSEIVWRLWGAGIRVISKPLFAASFLGSKVGAFKKVLQKLSEHNIRRGVYRDPSVDATDSYSPGMDRGSAESI